MDHCIFQNFRKRGDFRNFLLGIYVPFDFPPVILGWIVCFSEIQEFPDFLETFPGNLPPFRNFWKFETIQGGSNQQTTPSKRQVPQVNQQSEPAFFC